MSIEIPGIVEHIIFPSVKKHDVKDGFAIFAVSLNGFSSKYNVDLEKEVTSKLRKKNNGYRNYDTFTVTVDSFQKNEQISTKSILSTFIHDIQLASILILCNAISTLEISPSEIIIRSWPKRVGISP